VSDYDLMDARGDQLADDRATTGITVTRYSFPKS
jgi:hypothetical protein